MTFVTSSARISGHKIGLMAPIEINKTQFKFSYVTKPKPDGGFIAHPSDPSMETLEGATEEEVQQKVLAAMNSLTAKDIANLLKGHPLSVKLNGRATVVFNSKAGITTNLNPGTDLETGSSTSDVPTPIQFERNKMLWPAIVLVGVVALILYLVLR